VSSPRAAKPSVPFGGWFRGQDASVWLAVYSSAPQIQLAEGTKPHLCILLSGTVQRQYVGGLVWPRKCLGRVIPGGGEPAKGTNEWRREVIFLPFHIPLIIRHSIFSDNSKKCSFVLNFPFTLSDCLLTFLCCLYLPAEIGRAPECLLLEERSAALSRGVDCNWDP